MLSAIVIPNTIVRIESFALFDGCDSLADIYFCGSEEEWNSIETSRFIFENKQIHFNYKIEQHNK